MSRLVVIGVCVAPLLLSCGGPSNVDSEGSSDPCDTLSDEPDRPGERFLWQGYIMVVRGSGCPKLPEGLRTLGCSPSTAWTGITCEYQGVLENQVRVAYPDEGGYGFYTHEFVDADTAWPRFEPWIEQGPGEWVSIWPSSLTRAPADPWSPGLEGMSFGTAFESLVLTNRYVRGVGEA